MTWTLAWAEIVEDETELIDPEDVLETKSQGAPSSSTASSILDKRQFDREISFNQLPEGDILLCTKKQNVLNGTSGVTHGSVKIHSPVGPAKVR